MIANPSTPCLFFKVSQAASHFTKHSENPRQQYSCLVTSLWTKGLTCPKSINMLSLVLVVFDQMDLHSRTMKKCVALNGNLKRFLIKSAECKRDVLISSGDNSGVGWTPNLVGVPYDSHNRFHIGTDSIKASTSQMKLADVITFPWFIR